MVSPSLRDGRLRVSRLLALLVVTASAPAAVDPAALLAWIQATRPSSQPRRRRHGAGGVSAYRFLQLILAF